MSKPPISKDSPSAIYSPESADGRAPLNSQDGQQADLFGQVLAPASHSHQSAKKKDLPMIVIYGHSGSNSSGNATQKQSMGNKSHPQKLSDRSLKLISLKQFGKESLLKQIKLPTLLLNQQLLDINLDGSIECILTWKDKVTPSGRQYCQLAVSARPIKEIDSGMWPTHNARVKGVGEYTDPQKILNRWEKGHQHNLSEAARIAGMWPTPTSLSGGSETSNPPGNSRNLTKMREHALHAIWSTPSTRDHKDSAGMSTTGVNPDGSERSRMDQLPRQVFGTIMNGSNAPTENPGASPQLNPAFVYWLMGFPKEWVFSVQAGMQLSSKWRRGTSKQPCKGMKK